MYQVYYHQDQTSVAKQGDETRVWLFGEHTFSMLGFGSCSNVSQLQRSWGMHETEDSLTPAMGMQLVSNILYKAGARIQSSIRELSAYNDEDVDLIRRWSLSVKVYGSFYNEDSMQGRQPVDDLEWVALSSLARQMNPVPVTMTNPIPDVAYSCREQRVVVGETEYQSWNGITEFAGGFNYDTSSDEHSYVSARFALQMQIGAAKLDESEESSTERYLVAIIATSGHGCNFIEVTVAKAGVSSDLQTSVLEWRRLSEPEIVKRKEKLLADMGIQLDNPEQAEISRRWRDLNLPKDDESILYCSSLSLCQCINWHGDKLVLGAIVGHGL